MMETRPDLRKVGGAHRWANQERDEDGHFSQSGDTLRLGWWEVCNFARFMVYLRSCEERRGVDWGRADAYDPSRRGVR